MISFRLTAVFVVLAIARVATQGQPSTPRFYPDDPLRAEPAPLPVADLEPRALSDVLERVNNTFKKTGQRHPANGVIPAGGVNSLGEVMDGDWYVNRHGMARAMRTRPTLPPRGASSSSGRTASIRVC
jgi:hypothetical protein